MGEIERKREMRGMCSEREKEGGRKMMGTVPTGGLE